MAVGNGTADMTLPRMGTAMQADKQIELHDGREIKSFLMARVRDFRRIEDQYTLGLCFVLAKAYQPYLNKH